MSTPDAALHHEIAAELDGWAVTVHIDIAPTRMGAALERLKALGYRPRRPAPTPRPEPRRPDLPDPRHRENPRGQARRPLLRGPTGRRIILPGAPAVSAPQPGQAGGILHTAADLAAFDDLPAEERARVARLVMTAGCSLSQALAAVAATRAMLAEDAARATQAEQPAEGLATN